jgi:hypothetical protein
MFSRREFVVHEGAGHKQIRADGADVGDVKHQQ